MRHIISSTVRPKSQGLNVAIIIIGIIVLAAILPVTIMYYTKHIELYKEMMCTEEYPCYVTETVAWASIVFGLALFETV